VLLTTRARYGATAWHVSDAGSEPLMTDQTDEAVEVAPAWVDAARLLLAAADATARCGRTDLEGRLRAASSAVIGSTAVVCLVGEFKQGKSSLVNALLGQDVCPVDDDIATAALTIVYDRDPPQAAVRRREGAQSVVEEIRLADVAEYVSEHGNADNARRVERVDVGIPNPVLRHGLALVDTPGAGSLTDAGTTATLALLASVDLLLFVSDASSELTGPEGAFLERALEVCPAVVFCLTKTDLYPEWRRIAELDGAHLRDLGVRAPVVALSSPLRRVALERSDERLDAESGFPRLLQALQSNAIEPVRRRDAKQALADAEGPLDQLVASYRAELDLLHQNDAELQETLGSLEESTARLEHLRGPGARWSVLLNDGISDVSNRCSHGFRDALRSVSRDVTGSLEDIKSSRDWDEVSAQLQAQVAEAVAAAFADLEADIEDLRASIADVLQDDDVVLAIRALPMGTDVRALWTGRPLEKLAGTKVTRGASRGWAAVRGGSGALITFSLLTQFMPAAGSALLFTTPVSAGIGLAFGSGILIQQRKQRVAARRQQAQVATREFLDEVQFQVGEQLTEQLRSAQRDLRDGFTTRVNELFRTYTETAQRAEANAQSTQADRDSRSAELGGLLSELEALPARAHELEARL